MKNTVNVGIIGLGTVGTGVVKILQNIDDIVREKTGGDGKIVIKTLADKYIEREDWGFDTKNIKITNNVDDIFSDSEIDIVVELIGGYEPARTFILKAINNKKHVVTANKAVLAKYWDEINEACVKNSVLCYFEASVGAGIPAIQGINEGLAGNRFSFVCGILNGTTNFILTKMLKENMSYDEALKLAQKLGFAEADPTYDVKAIDSAHKIAILASIAYGKTITVEDVYKEGIDEIDIEDVKFVKKELGMVVKLLAIAKKTDAGLEMRVHPSFVPENHLLGSVDNEYNAVYVEGNASGKIMFYGKGAGSFPAASGVVSDVIYIAKNIVNGTAGKNQFVAKYDNTKELKVLKIDEILTEYYVRFNVLDKIGVLSKISDILANHNVSIANCYQKESLNDDFVPLIITTHFSKEADIKKAISEIDKLDCIKQKSVFVRIERNF